MACSDVFPQRGVYKSINQKMVGKAAQEHNETLISEPPWWEQQRTLLNARNMLSGQNHISWVAGVGGNVLPAPATFTRAWRRNI